MIAPSRPVAVRVIVVILVVQAAVALVASVLVPLVPALTPLLGPLTALLAATLVEPPPGALVGLAVVVNAVWVVVAGRLWLRHGGARTALGFLGVASVLMTLTFALSEGPVGVVVDLLLIAGTVTALGLLLRRDVRDWYRPG
ncbi:hypothetical protein [Actinomycetospora flava]|uniref:Uncharacterized protein n=1 Tax=Actinomycetospora flava TaxID=3129232 RepID=A0ABU8LXU7_9PSEU